MYENGIVKQAIDPTCYHIVVHCRAHSSPLSLVSIHLTHKYFCTAVRFVDFDGDFTYQYVYCTSLWYAVDQWRKAGNNVNAKKHKQTNAHGETNPQTDHLTTTYRLGVNNLVLLAINRFFSFHELWNVSGTKADCPIIGTSAKKASFQHNHPVTNSSHFL